MPKAWYNKGYNLKEFGMKEEAINAYEKAIEAFEKANVIDP